MRRNLRLMACIYVVTVFAAVAGENTAMGQTAIMDRITESVNSNLLFENRWRIFLGGLAVTVKVSLWSILLATSLGSLLCAMRMNRRSWMRNSVRWYVELMRAIPILVLLLLMFYVILTNLPLSGMWIAILCFMLYFSAYFCETFRAGIEGVGKGQWEAGYSLGMSPALTFMKVILPQALTRIIPVYKGQMVTLVKSTSILGYVAVVDLTRSGDLVRSRTFDAFFPLLLVAAVYLILSWILGSGLDLLGRKISPKNRSL